MKQQEGKKKKTEMQKTTGKAGEDLARLAGCQITRTQTPTLINELHKQQLKPWALIQWKWKPVKKKKKKRMFGKGAED